MTTGKFNVVYPATAEISDPLCGSSLTVLRCHLCSAFITVCVNVGFTKRHKIVHPVTIQTHFVSPCKIVLRRNSVVWICTRGLESLNVILFFLRIDSQMLQCMFLQQLIITVADVVNNFHSFTGVDDFHLHSSSSHPQSPVRLPLPPPLQLVHC